MVYIRVVNNSLTEASGKLPPHEVVYDHGVRGWRVAEVHTLPLGEKRKALKHASTQMCLHDSAIYAEIVSPQAYLRDSLFWDPARQHSAKAKSLVHSIGAAL